ncbi:hypothetical protein SGLAM104S_08654 [Streptomyces glaucescens]
MVVGLAVLWPGGAPAHERTGVGFDRQTQQATVISIEKVDCDAVNASAPPTGDTSTAEGSSAQQQADGTCKKATHPGRHRRGQGRTFTEIVQPDQSSAAGAGQECDRRLRALPRPYSSRSTRRLHRATRSSRWSRVRLSRTVYG